MGSGQSRPLGHFASLPAEVRANIYSRAVRNNDNNTTPKPPQAYVLTLTREDANPTEDSSARAARVNVSIDRAEVGRYSSQWRINELASINRDAAESVTWAMARQFGDLSDESREDKMVQASGQECDFLRLIDGSRDLIIVKESNERPRGYQLFYINDNTWEPAVLVSSRAELRTGRVWMVQDECPSLGRICQPLDKINHVAFVCQKDYGKFHPEFAAHRLFRIEQIRNPDFAFYLLDESITLRAGLREPPAGTPSFAGHLATFYEVNGDPAIWDIPGSDNDINQPPFEYAYEVERTYYKVPFKVLACIPNARAT